MKKLMCLFLLLIGFVNGQEIFWENEFQSALAERSRFFQNYEIDRLSPQFGKWQKAEQDIVFEKLGTQPSYDNLWYNYTLALTKYRQGDTKAETLFGNALSLATYDPGSAWLLFMEFYRQGILVWEEKALLLLHKQMVLANVESSPLVAQQLYALAARDEVRFQEMVDWAQLFDPQSSQKILHELVEAFPSNLWVFFDRIAEIKNLMLHSWEMQATLLYYLMNWLRTAVIFFFLAILFFLLFKHGRIALHPIVDLLPKSLGRKGKAGVVFLGLLLVFLGGYIPFIWLVCFLLWKHAEKNEKKALFVILLCVTLSPLEAKFRNALIHPILGDHSLASYQKIVREGYSTELKEKLLDDFKSDNENFLNHLSLVVLYSKSKEYNKALKSAFSADYIEPNNSAVKVVLGNVHFYLGKTEKAIEYYREALEVERNNPYALFNLSQLYNVEMSRKGEDAGKYARNPRIRTLLKTNELHFSTVMPKSRVVVHPKFSSIDFWGGLMWLYGGSWEDARVIWKKQFIGMSPLGSLGIFVILLLFLVYKHRTKWYRKPLWAIEITETENSRASENNGGELRDSMGVFMARRFRYHVLNILFPGLGSLYVSEQFSRRSLLILFLTSFFYVTYFTIGYWSFQYPFWESFSLYFWVLLLPVAYNVSFFLFGVFQMKKDHTYKEAIDGV